MAKALSPKVRQVALELIDPPAERVRLEIDPERINELAQSIQERGLLQPIILRENGDRFEIVAGERRFLAFKQLGLEKIWATVRKMSDKDVALDRATENLQRDELSPVEEGAIYDDLMETHKLTAEEVGRRMGKSGYVVISRIHLLRLPEVLQKAVHIKKVSPGAARELARIKDAVQLEYYTGVAVTSGATRETCRGFAEDWISSERLKSQDVPGGGLPAPPFEDKPHYVTCDTCHGAMELGKEKVFRVCPGCGEAIDKGMKE